ERVDGRGRRVAKRLDGGPNHRLEAWTFFGKLIRKPAVADDKGVLGADKKTRSVAAEAREITDIDRMGDEGGIQAFAAKVCKQAVATRGEHRFLSIGYHWANNADFRSANSGIWSASNAAKIRRTSGRTRHSAMLLPNGLSQRLNSRIMATAHEDIRRTFLQS